MRFSFRWRMALQYKEEVETFGFFIVLMNDAIISLRQQFAFFLHFDVEPRHGLSLAFISYVF